MNVVNTFSTIIITNVTTQTIVQTLPFNTENEKKADSFARQHNIKNPMLGMLSVMYK